MKKFIIILFFIGNTFALPLKFDNKTLNIEAEEVEILQNNQQIIFKDNVKVKNDDFKLNADNMVVFYDGKNEVKEINAKNNVKLFSKNVKINSEEGLYEAKKNLITMSKNANAIENGVNISADIFKYNTITKKSNIESKRGEKIKIILYK
ncbi:MAG: hypothetical protein LBT02_03090 [Rickettsiales bacterium]|jgi:lipopolysaccharide transport protein LptA|nr:hypothetical protein [Rickettsiales bacterium]